MNIQEEIRVYQVDKCISFRKTTEKFGGLSNMASGYPIVVNNIFIRTSEALYQALRYSQYPKIQEEIISQSSPMTAKMKSKKHIDKIREDWDTVRVHIMRWSLRIKLLQNKDTFGKLLLETGDVPIVEESSKDTFWGAKLIDNRFEGMNVLGRLLMQLREEYKQYNLYVIKPLNIDNFDLYDMKISSTKEKDKETYELDIGLFK